MMRGDPFCGDMGGSPLKKQERVPSRDFRFMDAEAETAFGNRKGG